MSSPVRDRVNAGYSLSEGKAGFRILRKSGGKNRQDAGGGWWLLSMFSICGVSMYKLGPHLLAVNSLSAYLSPVRSCAICLVRFDFASKTIDWQ